MIANVNIKNQGRKVNDNQNKGIKDDFLNNNTISKHIINRHFEGDKYILIIRKFELIRVEAINLKRIEGD